MDAKSIPGDLLEAGHMFRESLVERRDMTHLGAPRCPSVPLGAPLWHGWALMEAFAAGAKFAELKNAELRESHERLRAALNEILEVTNLRGSGHPLEAKATAALTTVPK